MDSGTLFGCLLGMVEAPMLKCICNPSAAAGGRDKVCCTTFQTTLLVVCFKNFLGLFVLTCRAMAKNIGRFFHITMHATQVTVGSLFLGPD